LTPAEARELWAATEPIRQELAREREMLEACKKYPNMKFRLRTKIEEKGGRGEKLHIR